MNLYIDGELADSTSVIPFDTNTTFTYNYLGTNVSKDNWFSGTIGYFKVWDNYELTSEDIDYSYSTVSPDSSFVLNGSNRSLTDVYSSATLTLNNSPTFDFTGVDLAGRIR